MIAAAAARALTNEEYHADTSHVSNTMIKDKIKSNRRYEALYVTKTMQREPPTKAQDIGTAAHAAILEPDTIDRVCRVIPREVLNKDGHRKGKAWKQYEAENEDAILLSPKDHADVLGMRESVYRDKAASRLLKANGEAERSIFWKCEKTGVLRKVRPDFTTPGWCVDVKTTSDCSPEWFSQYCKKFGYHLQQASYSSGIESLTGERPKFAFIAVETAAPYLCRVLSLDGPSIELGEWLTHAALRQIAARLESGDWSDPGENQVTEISLPRWAFNQAESEDEI